MLTFEAMFVVIDKTLCFFGLSDIYAKSSKHSERFIFLQRVFYVMGFIHMLPLLTGEVLLAVVLMMDGNSDDLFLKIADLMPCFLTSMFSVLKTSTMVWKRKQISSLVEEFRYMWPIEQDDTDLSIVVQQMVPTKQFCLVYTIVTNVLSMVYNIFPLIVMAITYVQSQQITMLLPYYIWYPYDWSSSSLTYALTYVSQFYAGLFTTAGVSSVDCFFCLMVANLCMQFKLLCNRILNINTSKEFPRLIGQKKNLIKIVEYHTKLIRLVREVESIFSMVLLLNLVASSLMICLLIFSVTISPPARIVKYLLFLSSSITQIMMMSWYGNKLIEESSGVAKAAYESEWVGAGRDHCQGIMMLQARGFRPLAISAMGFTNISLSTFSSILSASWSYFTLLRTVYQKHEK